ncbi:MAG TPA: hypothetical protein VFP17_01370 [Solirubrobacterales bacterium]|nr:hypothetical protein [Solirubrobacterales bacterium]
MSLVSKRLSMLLAIASVATLVLAGSARAALSVAPVRTFPMGSLYGLAPDGTIWATPSSSAASSVASFSHFDDEGNDLGDGFSVGRNNYFPLGIGYYGNRVYVTDGGGFGGRLLSYQADSADPGHDLLYTDTATDERMGSNQAALRVFSDGSMAVALGQENKVATLDGKDLTKEHPFYPQAFHGAAINKYFNAEPPYALESCVLGLGGPPVFGDPGHCGIGDGRAGPDAPDGVDYPDDIAFGLGGIYIAEGGANRITHYNTVANPGATLDLRFGGPGSGAGQLSGVASIVRQPSTGWIYASEEGNQRISVFDGQGNFIAAFGYGVFNGADELQVCGLEIGPCRAGVSDPRSYFSRLDFAPNGDLYAYMPLLHQIQVFQLNGGPEGGNPAGPAASGGSGGPSAAATPQPEKDKVRIKAKPLKVKKGAKTKLTAIVNPPGTCQQRLVLFQRKVPRSWENLGKALKPGKGCTVSKLVKVTAKSVYRAVLIGGSNHATLGYSPSLTVKLK